MYIIVTVYFSKLQPFGVKTIQNLRVGPWFKNDMLASMRQATQLLHPLLAVWLNFYVGPDRGCMGL